MTTISELNHLNNLTLAELNSPEILANTTFVPNPNSYITVRGAKEHNLKNVSVIVPKNKLVVFSGLSGSGKSSLVFDTIYAEGQRRYVESLSSYARQFLGLKEKPDVESIDGLSPAISIDQKSTSQNPRSTVGTITEIYDYLRLLFAKIGQQHCTVCDAVIANESVTSICSRLIKELDGKTVIVLSPVVTDQKGVHKQHISEAKKNGFRRIRVNGDIILIEEAEKIQLSKQLRHTIEVVIDRVTLNDDNKIRLMNSLETAMKYSNGKALIFKIEEEDKSKQLIHVNKNRACPNGHGTPDNLEPRLFSFNSPHGACTTCNGLGVITEIDDKLIVPNETLSILEGCLKPISRMSLSGGWLTKTFQTLSVKYNFELEQPWNKLPQKVRDIVLYGNESFEGIIINLKRRYKDTTSDAARRDIESYMNKKACPDCKGARLKPEALSVTLSGQSINHIVHLSIKDALAWFTALRTGTSLTKTEAEISRMILREVEIRLKFLQDVGLEYLTLSRSADTLSGGEAQRIRLATQIGSGLTGVLYILDEPSIGLHQRDNTKLLNTLKKLRDLGNTVLVVEHDEETIMNSDYIVDVGPKAGINGGQIVATGTPQEIIKNNNSPTGRFLAGIDHIELPKKRRKVLLKSIITKENMDDNQAQTKIYWSNQIERVIKGY
ncbi:MAG: excinuclease ABC subunit UvrA [Candidatus Parcubacteria bacterium]|nr:excinuclease ABC subunit UvrA [Candidatus Paceibacterota bacterium]